MSPLAFERHETHTRDGRRMAVWTLAPADPVAHALPVVIGAGFGLRMHHFCQVAMYCAHNGFFTCRYDPVNHVGLSDGEMWDFTMTDSLESLRAAVDWTCAYTCRPEVAIVATSLTARVALALAAQSERVGLVVTAVGVTNVRATLRSVFGADYSHCPEDALPQYVVFEGKQIGRNFVRDANAHDWWSLDGCIRALARIRRPVVNFIGGDDAWVDPADVHRAFDEGAAGARKLLTLERAPHDLGRNAAVATTFLARTTEELLAHLRLPTGVRMPAFEDMVEQGLKERRLQRERSAA